MEIFWSGPQSLDLIAQHEMIEVDVVDPCVFFIIRLHLHIRAHEMIALFHDDMIAEIPVHAVERIRRKIECKLFSACFGIRYLRILQRQISRADRRLRHRLSDIRIRIQPEFCAVEGLLIAQRAGIRDQPHITRRIFLIKAAIYEIADVINAVNLMQIVILSGEFAAAGIDPFSSVFAYLQAVFADRAIDAPEHIGIALPFLK